MSAHDDDPMAKYVAGMPDELQDILRKWSDRIAENEALEARVVAAETALAATRKALDEAQLRSIEARNPGIDMDEVRRLRALLDVPAADTTECRYCDGTGQYPPPGAGMSVFPKPCPMGCGSVDVPAGDTTGDNHTGGET